jgi:hypothetical protein
MPVEGYGCNFIKYRGFFPKWRRQPWVDRYASLLTRRLGTHARDQAAADASGRLDADLTAASDGRRRGWQAR